MTVGITLSCFDLFHAGHVLMLKEAKENCDYLIVALQSDPTIDRPEKNKPAQSLYERFVQLEGCKYVDEIVPYTSETEVEDILASILPDIRFIGEEYRSLPFTGKELCANLDIEIVYNTRRHNFSSSSLKKRIQKEQ